MDLKTFEKQCEKTDLPQYDKLQSRAFDCASQLHYALGLCTEAAELADAFKKHIAYGKPVDRTNVVEECGDLLYYVARLLASVDSSIAEAMELNMAKLAARYPSGFTTENALNRNLALEREKLEGR